MKTKPIRTYSVVCLDDDGKEISFNLLGWDERSVYEEISHMELTVVSVKENK